MTDFTRTTDSTLKRLYRRKSVAVAFLDESYLSVPVAGVPFYYAMTAVIISSSDLDSVRWAYAERAGHEKWHTTERFRDGRSHEIAGFVELLVTEADPVVVVVQIDAGLGRNDVEIARHLCLTKMVEILHDEHDVKLVVYERRRPGTEQSNDSETASSLRKSLEQLTIVDAWSGSEPLLWGPDVVAWTLQRKLVRGEAWFDPLVGVATIYRFDGSVLNGTVSFLK